jgi:DNA polymerase I
MMNSWGVIQIDTETTGRDAHINKILCIQFGNDEADTQIVVDASTIDLLEYKELLETKFLIFQNAKFDLQFLYSINIIPRRIYDTMIIEQLLHLGYPSGVVSYSLKSIAERRLNIDIDKSVRGEIIWRGLDTSVILYAAGDVKYLEKIMHSQWQDLVKQGLTKAAKIECEFVPCIAYLEWCGIHLDAKKWKAKMLKDQTELDIAKKALDNFVINHPTLSKKYSYINLQGDLFLGWDTTPKCIINWSSSAQVIQVAKELGFNTTVQDKKTGEDKDSVMEKHLKSQKGINDEFLSLYSNYQGRFKVVSSFGQGHLNAINPETDRIHTVYKQLGCASGRMSCGSQQPNKDLAQLKRISPKDCTYPNIQQLPADEETRGCFTAPKGYKWCSCDFSALESRLGADIYNEKEMLNEYLYGSGDLHSLMASVFFGDQMEEGITTKEIKKKYPHLRKEAKSPEFLIQFGGSAFGLAQQLGVSEKVAQSYVDKYYGRFKGIAKFKSEGSKSVREKGYILMCKYSGHKMYWYDHKEWLERQKSYTSTFWEDYKINHKGTGDAVAKEVSMHARAASKWDRLALNSVTQGSGIVILKIAMTNFFNWIVDNGYFGIVELAALVHDK